MPNSSSSSTSATAGGAAGPVEDKPPKKPKRKGGGKDRGPKDAVRKTEEEAASAEPANPSQLLPVVRMRQPGRSSLRRRLRL